jgi:glycosidase
MIKKFGWLFGFALFAGGCGTESDNKQKTIVYGSDIVGLASPVKLNFEKTTIYLADYFELVQNIDTVYFSDAMEFTHIADSGLVKVESWEGTRQINVMHVVYAGTTYQIPVFRNRSITYKFTYESDNASAKEVGLKGNFNGWNHKATLLSKDDETWTTELVLDPGLYEYLVVEDGREFLDPNNANKKDNGSGGYNSTFRVGESSGQISISTFGIKSDSIVVYYPEALLHPLVLWQNHQLDTTRFFRRGDRLSFAVPEPAHDMHRTFFRVFGSDDFGRTNDLLIPLEKGKVVQNPSQLKRTDKETMAMYFMMVDRFVNGDTTNDQIVNDPAILPPANYYGGDLAGVADKVDDGYIEKLGMNTIWLSPITQNPLGAYGLWDKGGVTSKFSGYHGYWPISSSQVDFRFGTSSELKSLTAAAHKNDMNIILDYVANHVHEEHPVYKEHPDWATELYLPDGSLNTERWDEYRLTTWFDTFMPTLDLERPEVVEAMSDSALYWFENYPIDGFRHDATKHIDLGFWRMLTQKLKYRIVVPEDRSIYQIGETYGNPELIGSYIGSGLLDAQFDFNIYDASVAAFAKPNGNTTDLKRVLDQSLVTYGYHHLMGNISGNQDRPRFISYADGSVEFSEDAKQAGWTRKVEIKDKVGYRRLASLHAFNFTIPGIPVIYYGDEIGMPGAGDPDNRRMMRFGDQLSADEAQMLKIVTQIAHLRKNHMALLYGDLHLLESPEHTMVYLRNYFDQTAIAAFNTSTEVVTVSVEIPAHFNIEKIKANFDNIVEINNRIISITLPPDSFEILTN